MMIERKLPKGLPDYTLSIERLIMKHRKAFARYFMPKYTYSVIRCEERCSGGFGEESSYGYVYVTARVKLHHRSTKGKTYSDEITMERILKWRENLRLYDFIGASG